MEKTEEIHLQDDGEPKTNELLLKLSSMREKWARTAVFLKAFYLLALTALLLFGQYAAIELQVFAAILAVGFWALDFFCLYKRTVYAVNAERLKVSSETFVFDDCVKPFKESEKWGKSAVCSAVWYALLFIAVVIFLEAIA